MIRITGYFQWLLPAVREFGIDIFDPWQTDRNRG